MLDLLIAKLSDGHFLAGILVALGCAATVLTVAMPLLQTDNLGRRMKAVSTERERIRPKGTRAHREQPKQGGAARRPQAAFQRCRRQVEFDELAGNRAGQIPARDGRLSGRGAEYTFLFFRLVIPIVLFLASLLYMFAILHWDKPFLVKFGIAIAAMYLGIKAPEVFLSNTISKRKRSMERAYPNTLDLLLICVESGMSIEHAFRKVSMEIGSESIAMAEEMTLLAAEMSFLPDRRTAFENLGVRTGLASIRSLVTVLVQAERYGTPLGAALRVLGQESRDARMTAAEKKAASLPPALTVPMILFFLPGLFAAILTPAIIQINHWT